jgi:glycerate dehydrogenase
MMKSVFLDTDSLDRGDLNWSSLEDLSPDLVRHSDSRPEQVVKRIRDSEILISNKVVLDRPILEQPRKSV